MKKNRCLMIRMVLMCLWWLERMVRCCFMVPNEGFAAGENSSMRLNWRPVSSEGNLLRKEATRQSPSRQDALKLGKDNCAFHAAPKH